jgi:hypothetical protein
MNVPTNPVQTYRELGCKLSQEFAQTLAVYSEKNPKFAAPAANCELKKKRRDKEKEDKRGEKKRRNERKCRRFCGRSPFLRPQKNEKKESAAYDFAQRKNGKRESASAKTLSSINDFT